MDPPRRRGHERSCAHCHRAPRSAETRALVPEGEAHLAPSPTGTPRSRPAGLEQEQQRPVVVHRDCCANSRSLRGISSSITTSISRPSVHAARRSRRSVRLTPSPPRACVPPDEVGGARRSTKGLCVLVWVHARWWARGQPHPPPTSSGGTQARWWAWGQPHPRPLVGSGSTAPTPAGGLGVNRTHRRLRRAARTSAVHNYNHRSTPTERAGAATLRRAPLRRLTTSTADPPGCTVAQATHPPSAENAGARLNP